MVMKYLQNWHLYVQCHAPEKLVTVGVFILTEGLIAVVTAIIVVCCWLNVRYYYCCSGLEFVELQNLQ